MRAIRSCRSLQKSYRHSLKRFYTRATGVICSFPRANRYFALLLTKKRAIRAQKNKERNPNPGFVWPWSNAGPAGRVRCWQVKCRERKTGQQKVQLFLRRRSTLPSTFIYLSMLKHTTSVKFFLFDVIRRFEPLTLLQVLHYTLSPYSWATRNSYLPWDCRATAYLTIIFLKTQR